MPHLDQIFPISCLLSSNSLSSLAKFFHYSFKKLKQPEACFYFASVKLQFAIKFLYNEIMIYCLLRLNKPTIYNNKIAPITAVTIELIIPVD